MSKNKNRKGFFLELYKIMKSIKVFNKLDKQRCPNKLSLQRCCQKKNYMQRKCQTMKNILMVLFKHDILKNVVSKKYRDKMFTVILPCDTKYSAINIQGFCLIYIQCFCPRIMILVYKPSVQKIFWDII